MVTRYWIFPNWLQRWITIWYTVGGLLLAISLVADVILIAEQGREWFLFQRAGALLVIIGIWLGFYGLIRMSNVASHGQWTVDLATELGATRIRRKNRGKSEAEVKELIDQNIVRAKKEARDAVQTAQGIHWAAEAVPLALGTLIWAFGDLMSKGAAHLYLWMIAA